MEKKKFRDWSTEMRTKTKNFCRIVEETDNHTESQVEHRHTMAISECWICECRNGQLVGYKCDKHVTGYVNNYDIFTNKAELQKKDSFLSFFFSLFFA